MKVRNFNGNKNHFVIIENNKITLQSYNSIVCVIDYNQTGNDWIVTLGKHWDYSVTTMKYLNQFLGKECHNYFLAHGLDINSKGIRKGIAQGILEYDDDLV